MKLISLKSLSLIFAFSGLTVSGVFAAEAPSSFADLVEKLTPSVVNISTTQKLKDTLTDKTLNYIHPRGEESPAEPNGTVESPEIAKDPNRVYSLGSGFIIDANGYVATNNHVIADAEEITVILSDDTRFEAKIVGRDVKTDLALLKINTGHKLQAVTMGDSDKSRVGDWIIAIGNPFGFGGTVTAGIISARARNINAGLFDDFIQTDAAINRGNSGGPMFNIKGEVIGINTAIFSPSGENVGIGFAMPMALAKNVFTQLKTTGHVERSWLGIKIQDVKAEIAKGVGLKKPIGALVMRVTKNGPAYKAGLLSGDVITRFDGREIKEMRTLPLLVAETGIGKNVPVEIYRKGEPRTLHVKVGELKDNE